MPINIEGTSVSGKEVKVIVRKVYKFRVDPTKQQAETFMRYAGARRFIWNWALAKRIERYKETGKSMSPYEQSAMVTQLKREPETMWLRDVDSQMIIQPLFDLDKAYAGFFRRVKSGDGKAGFPKFKSRKTDTPRFRIPGRVKVVDGCIDIPIMRRIKIRQSREVEGKVKNATFKMSPTGHWMVAIVVEVEMPDTALPAPDPAKSIGVDLGLKDLVVTSDGERVLAPKFYRKEQRKLRRAQRQLSRKKAGSQNRQKAKRKVAIVHGRIAAKRSDFCHKMTTSLVREHDAVLIEDLSVKGLARTKLAKSMLDASLGEIRRQLTYKGEWYRKHVVTVDRFYPSTRLCYQCGFKNDELTLNDRTWTCPGCGTKLDRDLNAAMNIKREGLRILAS